MQRRRVVIGLVVFLGLFLVGTVVVLTSISVYLAIDPSAYLSELEVPLLDNVTRWNASEHGFTQRIPRIIHQTWKTETLPPRWQAISQACRDMMPDYEYMLWTDDSSREFIRDSYPWFLDTFDNYKYNIQRADAIRYFVLHHYGGVYMDLDIGCLKPLDPLLIHSVILPKTIPVGVSNDLMFAEKAHPFLAQTIHNLATFNYNWILNYPTVMFSTGPMFLSAQYAIFSSSRFGNQVRILPKSLYGKNAKEDEAPNSFFTHFYGSSWHADDASFIWFLGTWGKGLMWLGLAVLFYGVIRLALPNKQRRYSLRRYDVLFPRISQRGGWHVQLGSWSSQPSSPPSPDPGSDPSSPTDSDVPVIHLPFDVRPSSPASSDATMYTDRDYNPTRTRSPVYDVFRKLRDGLVNVTSSRDDVVRRPLRSHRERYSRGVLFFLPAIFTSRDVESGPSPRIPLREPSLRHPDLPPEKQRFARDFERAGLLDNNEETESVASFEMNSQSSQSHGLHSRQSSMSDDFDNQSPNHSRLSSGHSTSSRSRSVSRHRDP